jgi:hypothetical protein
MANLWYLINDTIFVLLSRINGTTVIYKDLDFQRNMSYPLLLCSLSSLCWYWWSQGLWKGPMRAGVTYSFSPLLIPPPEKWVFSSFSPGYYLTLVKTSVYLTRNYLTLVNTSVYLTRNYLALVNTSVYLTRNYLILVSTSVYLTRNYLTMVSTSVYLTRNYLTLVSTSVYLTRNYLTLVKHLSLSPKYRL